MRRSGRSSGGTFASGGGDVMGTVTPMDLPKCQKCGDGSMIPLSDCGQGGSAVVFKAWVCANPECGFSIRVDKGEITYGKKPERKH